MRLNIASVIFALSGSMVALAAPWPQTGITTPSQPVGDAVAVINSLSSAIAQYNNNIKSAIFSLGLNTDPAAKSATAQVVGLGLQNITAAMNQAAFQMAWTKRSTVDSRQAAPATLEDLVTSITSLAENTFGAVTTSLPVLDSGSIGDFIGEIIAAFDNFITVLSSFVQQISPFLTLALQLAVQGLSLANQILQLINKA